MIDDFAKSHLRDKLHGVRDALVWMLFNIMAARLCDATRHAGHSDILRETIDGSVCVNRETT